MIDLSPTIEEVKRLILSHVKETNHQYLMGYIVQIPALFLAYPVCLDCPEYDQWACVPILNAKDVLEIRESRFVLRPSFDLVWPKKKEDDEGSDLTEIEEPIAIICKRCKTESSRPSDIKDRYCAVCQKAHVTP